MPPRPADARPDAPTDAPTDAGAAAPHLPYMPGLDGLRAIAVVAVLLYHAGLEWIPGGFLGVEVFFVISGYLITSLLLAEHRRDGAIRLSAFWLRRARRLLPALFVLLAVVTTFALLFLRSEVASLRGDVIGALTYSANWHLVVSDQSYFETIGRPSPLQHLWSLAVEEQFYVVWPLLFALGTAKLGRARLARLVAIGAVASAAWMWWLHVPGSDPSRVYYGSDTRASGLLVGALLAFVWSPRRLSERAGRFAPALIDVVGMIGLALVVRAFLRTGEFDDGLYRGGFLGLSVATAVVIGAAVHPAGHLGRLLGARPLRWIGLRSYSIYLWHWPVYVVTRPEVDVPLRGAPLLVLRLALTTLLASMSYRWVETPVRRGAVGRVASAVREATGARRRLLALRWVGVAGALVLVTGSLGVAVAQATPPAPPEYLTVESTPSLIDADGRVVATRPPATAERVRDDRERRAPPTSTTTAVPRPPTISAFGDSVMLGAAGALDARFPRRVHVDAAVARATSTGIEIMRLYEAAGVLGKVVIVHLGNNGTFSDAQFDEMMEVVGKRRTVIVLNVKVPRRWEVPNNEVIHRGAKRYANAYLLDWKKEGSKVPGVFWDDTMHLRPIGAVYYAALVERRLERVA